MKLHNLLAGENVVFLCYGTITSDENLVASEMMEPAAVTIRFGVELPEKLPLEMEGRR
jgi:hypothetical protein